MTSVCDDDELDHISVRSSDHAPPVSSVVVSALTSIFDDDMIEKFSDPNGRKRWLCKWCGNSYADWHATKAVAHVNKILGADIKPCTVKMDAAHAAKYESLLSSTKKLRHRQSKANLAIDRSIVTHNSKSATSLDEKRRSSVSCFSSCSLKKPKLGIASPENDLTSIQCNDMTSKSFIQMKLHDGPNPTADSKLTMAIADMIHSLGLPFSLCSEPKFRKVLSLSRAVGAVYTCPSRNQISGDLLDLNYDEYMKKNMTLLLKDVEIFGLTYYGDGATVKRMPLLNILCSGVHMPVAVLEIVECTGHMQVGGKKDAKYIAGLFRPHIHKVEEIFPNTTDVVIFDGASNVQKAAQVLEAIHPRICILHGAEHVVSLFFNDVFKLPVFVTMNTIVKRAYRIFGSGAMHTPYALFQKNSKMHNDQRNIGLIKAAGTRMAGCAIAMQRFLRLRPALISTVTSPEFLRLKIFPGMTKLLTSERLWNDMTIVVRALFPALILLRLADKKQPAMDKLYFYVRRMEQAIKRSKDLLDPLEDHYKNNTTSDNISKSMLSYFFNNDKEDYSYGTEFIITKGNTDDSDSEDEESIDCGEEDSDEYDSDDCDSGSTKVKSTNSLGEKLTDLWNHRKKKLESDLAISGWMVSPHAEIMDDVSIHHNGKHRDAVDRMLKKWMGLEVEYDKKLIGDLLNTFWEEFDEFHSKTGNFADREHIWNNSDVRDGNSHLWHKKYSLRYTNVFGKFACRVCSKILGIGSAERSWGDVKHLKTNKRSHLSGERVKKQATIFGASCMLRADIKRQFNNEDESKGPYKFWMEDDFDKEFDIFQKGGKKQPPRPIRIFKAWKEDWEEAAILKRDPVNEAKLLEKYGGLQWYDFDNKVMCTSGSDELQWTRKRGKNGGYCVIAYNEHYIKDAKDSQKSVEPWEFCHALTYCIQHYYKENKNLGVTVLELEPNETNDMVDEDDKSE